MAITITFSECVYGQDELSIEGLHIPMQERVQLYEEWLLDPELQNHHFVTHDEMLVLIAQWLYRRGKLPGLTLISQCDCRQHPRVDSRAIRLGEDGDMLDEPHHGFFSQRLKYLR